MQYIISIKLFCGGRQMANDKSLMVENGIDFKDEMKFLHNDHEDC